MSYTKQTWATGDVVTAEKMNHIEDGIADAFTFIDPDYSLGERVVVVPETIVTFSLVEDTDLYMSGADPISNIEIDWNSVYTVTWDGEEYDGIFINGHKLSLNQTSTYMIRSLGNSAVIEETSPYYTNAPFIIIKGYLESERDSWRIFTKQTQSSHTIKIEKALLTKSLKKNYLHEDTTFGRPLITFGSGEHSALLGCGAVSSAQSSIAMGDGTRATGKCAVAEGTVTIASGNYSHSEGGGTKALGTYAHAEGAYTEANMVGHAEGQRTIASGSVAHAEGNYTVASGNRSHAEGEHTIANHLAQHVFGKYNIADPSQAAANAVGNYVEIVGNGTAENARSNARTLDWSGNEELAGSITLGKGTADEVTLTAASLKSLLALLSN